MSQKKQIHSAFIIGLLISAGIVAYYYWTSEVLDAIRRVPMKIMLTCLVYVILQIGKRAVLKDNHWWDWLYYIGLLSVMIPTFMASNENADWLFPLTRIGSLFLLIPALFDIQILLKKSE